jgi:hypothetical protein
MCFGVIFSKNPVVILASFFYLCEYHNWQLATGNWQLATGNWQLATGNPQLTTNL